MLGCYSHLVLHVWLQMLEAKVDTFVTTELQNFQRILSLNDVEESEAQRTEEHEREDEGSREAFLKITLSMLRSMKEHQLADCLQTSKTFTSEREQR